ncbi:MAG: cytochrome c [Acidobacteria bacterium]|nr:cytochrome c [Acidobacteriota bacterium]
MKAFKIIALALTLSLAASVSLAEKEKKPKSSKKTEAKAPEGDVAKGTDLFEAKCMVCHNPDNNEKKIGPGLKGVKDGKLPSGKDATRETILEVVNTGGGGMPAYKDLLTDEEKNDVVAYVMTL